MYRLRERLKAMHSVELGPPPMPFHPLSPLGLSVTYTASLLQRPSQAFLCLQRRAQASCRWEKPLELLVPASEQDPLRTHSFTSSASQEKMRNSEVDLQMLQILTSQISFKFFFPLTNTKLMFFFLQLKRKKTTVIASSCLLFLLSCLPLVFIFLMYLLILEGQGAGRGVQPHLQGLQLLGSWLLCGRQTSRPGWPGDSQRAFFQHSSELMCCLPPPPQSR